MNMKRQICFAEAESTGKKRVTRRRSIRRQGVQDTLDKFMNRLAACKFSMWPIGIKIMDWTPISEVELQNLLIEAETRMSPPLLRLWKAIEITPQKWNENRAAKTAEGSGWLH